MASRVQLEAVNRLYVSRRGQDVRAGVSDGGQVDDVAVENLLIPGEKAQEVMLQQGSARRQCKGLTDLFCCCWKSKIIVGFPESDFWPSGGAKASTRV